jgi:hypothetical protein
MTDFNAMTEALINGDAAKLNEVIGSRFLREP